MNYIGLMSGTSMDAIDAVLISLSPSGGLTLRATHRTPYPLETKQQLYALRSAAVTNLDTTAELDSLLGELFAQAADNVRAVAGLAPADIRAIGSHGQTVRHRPAGPHPFSLQLANPSVVAERTGVTTVADFRARDIAAGGQGAPLVTAFHHFMFHSPHRNRAIINIGGIANASYLPADKQQRILGFDTGPGNLLLDAWIAKHKGQPYDAGGEWGAGGSCLPALLDKLCADPYFRVPPPKSSGFEYFNLAWLEHHLSSFVPSPAAEDVQTTLCALTARSIAHALKTYVPAVDELYVCGGGSHNSQLLTNLRDAMPGTPVDSTAALGLAPDWVEAAAFAWLAHQAMEGLPGNLPTVTGARHAAILGGIYKA
jgi:anhydro-N-acetylmuramic acid kinase